MTQCTTSFPCYPVDFYNKILCFLSSIKSKLEPANSGQRYDWELLCSESGDPVFVRWAYTTDGKVVTPNTAWNSDGTAYTATPISSLVACSGGSGPSGGALRWVSNLLCDPNTGFPVLLFTEYNIDGTIIGNVGYNPDGSAYSGSLSLLIACTGGSSPSTFNGFSWQLLCDPTTSRTVYVRISYNTSGTPTAIDGFYGDLSDYTGSVYNLVDCSQLSTGDESSQTWIPNNINTTIISNPGVGMQTVQRNLISTNALGINPNNYPMNCENYRIQWKEIEDAVSGVYDLTVPNQIMDDARGALQVVNLRILSYDPASGYSTPDFMYTAGGWQVTDDNGGGTFKLAWWGAAANITSLLNIGIAVNGAIGTHPAFNVLDAGWGDFDENTYSGSHFTGTLSGGAPNPGVGNPIPDLTLSEAQNFFNAYRSAYGAGRLMVTHAANQTSFNYAVGTLNYGSRMDGWGYRNNPGGCPGGGVQMCTDAPNTFLSTGTYPNAWKTRPNIEETWAKLYTSSGNWISSGYDYQASFNWATAQAHTSEINVKAQFNPPTSPNMKAALETMLLTLGYRFVLLSMTRPTQVEAGNPMEVFTSWSNIGDAPNYRNEVVCYRLWDTVTGVKYYQQTATPTSSWASGTSPTVTSIINIPSWFPTSSAVLSVGLAPTNPPVAGEIVPDIALSNNGNTNDWWYSFPGALQITNNAPTTVPTTVYAATFDGISQFLSSTSPLFRLDAKDWMISVVVPSLDTGANRGFVTKGFRNTAASQEYWVGYNSATDRIEASFSNGTTIYRATADNFGAVSLLPSSVYPIKILVEFNNTTKILALSVNSAPANTVTGTGSIAAGSNTFRIGDDSNNNFMKGQLTQVRIFHQLFGTGLGAYRQQLLDPAYLKYTDMVNQQKYGLWYSWEMSEASGSRIDSNCGRAVTDNNSVGRVALN